jgi:rSAM/selenodomain-associated transferase 2
MTISVIIPVLNEASNIENTLTHLLVEKDIELIVVDGGSKDRTQEIVKNLGLQLFICHESGRAKQMNLGAERATGDILLFLHADTKLPQRFQQSIEAAFQNDRIVAGAFNLHIDSQIFSLRIIEWLVRVRSHLCSLPYGDQAIFIKRDLFMKIGGFANLPIMEDFELIQRLQSFGKIAIVSESVVTSARRWQKLGVWRTTAINQIVIIGYYLGVSPLKLRNLYRLGESAGQKG